jgi:branched-chain amino acid transport system substrate-binding protein
MREHNVRMNMYIAQAKNGRFEIVESLGAIDPDEATLPSAAEFGRAPIGWSACQVGCMR